MAGLEERPPFEILEHTADIGLRARGRTLEELFENACLGMLEIMGAKAEEGSSEEAVGTAMSDSDLDAALVAMLNEVVYLVDRYQARVARVRGEVAGDVLWMRLLLGSSREPPDGTELKAATYHQLNVKKTVGGYEATVFFDV